VDLRPLAAWPGGATPRGACPAGLDDIAYGFYTTGSTGAPKCALNLHRGLLNRFLYMSRWFGGGTDEIVLQNSRHVFDSSLWQLLWPLTTGSRIVIPDRDGILDLAATVEVIARHGATMTDFVPSIFNTLVAMMGEQPDLITKMTSLRRVLIGGEEANAQTVQAFRAMLPGAVVVNTYGPTECSIGSVFHEITDDDTDTIPIGRPIDNTYAVIVDDQMRPAGPGELGEILLGGECLGLGYLNAPDRTSAAFVPNPFPAIPGPRLYRTGDLGRYRPDGLLLFAGRQDQQVKIAGVRVEVPEIEVALLRQPQVREAKVIVCDGAGGKWLMAFVTGGAGLDPRKLREQVAAELLPQFVPKEFVVLDRMPLNPNGKADRRELARLAAARRVPPAKAVPGEDGLSGAERAIWRLWLELVPIAPLALDDDFFDLGGDSLNAQKLALALARERGQAVSIRDIVERPTIAQQAALVGGVLSGAPSGAAAVNRTLMDTDAMLPAEICPSGVATPDLRPGAAVLRGVLLTGATGFVGAHLLHDLLATTTAEVYCLVRAGDEGAAQDRITANLANYRLRTEEFAGRIHAVPGDLAQPRFGLSQVRYQELASTVDTVLHNAAMVNLVRGYTAHRAVNVTGTVEILRFAVDGATRPVHYVSTLSALPFRSGDPADAVPEVPGSAADMPEGGYGQSKWVAERLLDEAARRGIPVTVYRLGQIMAHSVTGVPSRHGLPDLLVKACLRTEMSFTSPIVLNYTPVDCVSQLVPAAMRRGETGYFHIRHPEPVAFDNLLAALASQCRLPQVPYQKFWEVLRTLAEEETGDRELQSTLALLPRADEGTETETADGLAALFRDGAALCTADRAERLMNETGLRWPVLGADVFTRYAACQNDATQPPGVARS
jgi:amino acid adenylation domain-containing protein/thioester reductase-like protein